MTDLAGMTPAELDARTAAAHVDMDTPLAGVIRALLANRYGADMVTDELVAVTIHGMEMSA